MVVRYSGIFAFALVISSTIFPKIEGSSNCGALVKSTCTDPVTSKWNKHDVAHNLKTWVKQIEKLTSVKQADMKHFFARKKVLQDPKTNIVRYIANVNCLSQRTLGPVWKAAGTKGNPQLHDGFLYGNEDEKGTLSGM